MLLYITSSLECNQPYKYLIVLIKLLGTYYYYSYTFTTTSNILQNCWIKSGLTISHRTFTVRNLKLYRENNCLFTGVFTLNYKQNELRFTTKQLPAILNFTNRDLD